MHRSNLVSARFLFYAVVVLALVVLFCVQVKYCLDQVAFPPPEIIRWNESFVPCPSSNALRQEAERYQPQHYRFDDNDQEVFYDFYTDRADCQNSNVSSKTFVPIFIMTRDRVNGLREAVESYDNTISSPFEIIILDHNSTYPPMLEYLRYLQTERNIKVHPLKNPDWNAACWEADKLVQAYLKARPDVEFYVLTDPDIALKRTAPDILLYSAAILKSCPFVRVVGPHLQISDLPAHYTKKAHGFTVFERQARFWKKDVPSMATWKGLG